MEFREGEISCIISLKLKLRNLIVSFSTPFIYNKRGGIKNIKLSSGPRDNEN